MSQSNEPSSSNAPIDNQQVDNGQYFREGRAWARSQFETPMVERSYAMLALGLVITAFVVCVSVLDSLFPLKAPVKLIFTNDNSGYEFPRMVRIAEKGEPLQHSVARYVAKQYLIAYESYIYDREVIDQRYRLVYNQSAPEVFQKYRTILDPNNPQSPLNTLEQAAIRQINDVYVQITNPSTANGIFTATADIYYSEVIRTVGAPKKTRKKASLHFTMLELSIHKEDKSVYQYNSETQTMEPLKGRILFRVNSYSTSNMQQGQ